MKWKTEKNIHDNTDIILYECYMRWMVYMYIETTPFFSSSMCRFLHLLVCSITHRSTATITINCEFSAHALQFKSFHADTRFYNNKLTKTIAAVHRIWNLSGTVSRLATQITLYASSGYLPFDAIYCCYSDAVGGFISIVFTGFTSKWSQTTKQRATTKKLGYFFENSPTEPAKRKYTYILGYNLAIYSTCDEEKKTQKKEIKEEWFCGRLNI